MANYENGVATRQAVIDACKRLFLEKGYRETSYSDICNAAHVNRTTIYYHFKDKEQMRYEVLLACTEELRQFIAQYCDKPEYHYLLTACLQWYRIKEDPAFRHFQYSCCIDFPLLQKMEGLPLYYTLFCEKMWGAFFDSKLVPDLAFASFYGYVMCCIRMLCENPEHYNAMELFEYCAESGLMVWGIPGDFFTEIKGDLQYYLSIIPRHQLWAAPEAQ